nr:MAG TPA: hypothetical protein [Caudoviricetes sp.]
MTFKEIEQAVVKHLPLEDGAPLHEQMCYSTLRSLYADYNRGQIDTAAATQEKRRLLRAYSEAATKYEMNERLRDGWCNGIRVSDEFRCKLRKGIRDGEDIERLFPLACTCISALTGDATLAGSKVMRELEARQLELEE